MKAFYRDGFVGVMAETVEERDLLVMLQVYAARGAVRVNSCNDPAGGFKVALSVHPIHPDSEKIKHDGGGGAASRPTYS